MPRRRKGLLHSIVRRENGASIATDERNLLSYVEEKTASSCFKEKNCELSGTTRSTFLICFSHDRSKMASTHGDHTIRVVDSFTGRYVRTLQGHPRTPWCISFHPSNNNLLASGCLGGEVRIWDLMGGCEVYTPPEKAVIASLAFHPIEHVLLIATSNKLYFWQWEQPKPFACLETNFAEEKVRLVKFSPFGDYILTGITNCNHVEPSDQQSRTQASVDQVLQSVNCTQLDSDQVTEYIMQQTAGHGTRGSTLSGSPSHNQDENHSRPGPSEVPSTSNSTTTAAATNRLDTQDTRPSTSDAGNSASSNVTSNRSREAVSNPSDSSQTPSSQETRPMRNYRGVFALFRARDRGSWNLDTSQVDGDPTEVGRSSVLFSGTTTDSISVDRVGPTVSTSSYSMQSGTASDSNTGTIPVEGNGQEVASSDGIDIVLNPEPSSTSLPSSSLPSSSLPSSSLPSSLPSSSSAAVTSSFTSSAWSSSLTSSSSSSSSPSSQSSFSSNTSSSISSRQYSDNTSSLANILQGDHAVDMTTIDDMMASGASTLQDDLLRPTTNESVVSTLGNEDVSQSISILPINPSSSDNDVTVAMDTDAMETNISDYGSHNTRSTGVNVQIQSSVSDDSSPRENSDRYVSGVGSVINVGGASSRTSYVAHGSNYSSSLSTLSNQEGSGTAIATATARTFRHVHTAVVIANGNERGPQIALRTAINRAIAGAFAGSGEGAVASNIINTTHRLQWWDFSKCVMPDIKNANTNVIVPCCKIHNDASCDLSSDGTLLAAFVPSALGFPDDGMLAVYSMRKETLGQTLYTKKFGPNAISVSLSPLNTHVVVGLAARRIHWHLTSQQMMAQVFKLEPDKNSAYTFTELKSPVHSIVLNDEDTERRTYVSVNAAFWHPVVGCGLVYGTNRGDLRMRQFGPES